MKKFFLYFRRSLFKNDAAVEASTEAPFWWSIIVFVIAMIISLISIFTQTWVVNAADRLTPSKVSLYGVDDALVEFSSFLHENDLNYEIDVESDLLNSGEDKTSLATWNEKVGGDASSLVPAAWTYTAKITDYTNEDGTLSDKTVNILKVYDFTSYKNDKIITENLYRILTNFVNGEFVPDDATEYTATTVNSSNMVYISSFMILGRESYALYIFPYNTTTYSSVSGNYKTFTSLDKLNLNQFETLADWQEFVRIGYISQKNYSCLVQTGIVAGINVGVTVLLGFLLWIMTRGKQNPFRVYKFYQCLAVAFWASFTPAVIAMAVGFMSLTFATVIYVMIFGARTAFLASRNFRPVKQ